MESNPRNYYLIPLGLAFAMAIGLGLGNYLTPKTNYSFAEQKGEKYQKIQDILELLDKRYVDTVNGERLFEETISDMLHKLDPHSNYIAASDMKSAQESIEGKFGGIGVRFMILRDTVCITHVIKGSPSELAGAKAGDKILVVDKTKMAGVKITNDKVMGTLKGEEGTSIDVRVKRGNERKSIKIKRGSIPIPSVTAAFMMTNNIGFVHLESFSLTTTQEFKRATEKLLQQGMTKLIIDLRNNGGGVLSAAIELADEFLPKGLTIVETKGENQKPQKYTSSGGGLLERIETAVLINQYSASASEILAGALQDNDRAMIYGRRSFGKGLVQGDFNLRDGSNLRLTVARYYTPSGRCIQKEYNGSMEDYYGDGYERYENGELFAPDSTLFVDSLKFKTRKGRTVYGGGGIMPDVFIAFDTADSHPYFNQLRFSSSFQAFAFDFVDGKRAQWQNVQSFNAEFSLTNTLLKSFGESAEENFDIPYTYASLQKNANAIAKTLKAEIARQIWLEDGYYYVMSKTDSEIQTILNKLGK